MEEKLANPRLSEVRWVLFALAVVAIALVALALFIRQPPLKSLQQQAIASGRVKWVHGKNPDGNPDWLELKTNSMAELMEMQRIFPGVEIKLRSTSPPQNYQNSPSQDAN